MGFSKRSCGQKVHQNVYKCQQCMTRNLDTYLMLFSLSLSPPLSLSLSLSLCNMGQQYIRQTLASIVADNNMGLVKNILATICAAEGQYVLLVPG